MVLLIIGSVPFTSLCILTTKYPSVKTIIVAVIIPPNVVFTFSEPFMLKAGIGDPNLSIVRRKLEMCHGDSLNYLDFTDLPLF